MSKTRLSINNNQIRHVIFDIDGVLVDSNVLQIESLHDVMLEYGFSLGSSELLHSPIPTIAKLSYLEKLNGRELADLERKQFCARKYELLLSKLDKSHCNNKASACIRNLLDTDITVSYVSNAKVSYIKIILNMLGLDDTATNIIGNDSGLPHKPNTDMFLHVASVVELAPSQILVVEDTEANIIAAKRAGFNCFHVTTMDDIERIFNENNSTNGRVR